MPRQSRELPEDREVLARREVGVERELLRDEPESEARRAVAAGVAPGERDPPGVESHAAVDRADQGRLAGAVRPEERVDLAAPEHERRSVEREPAGEGAARVLDRQGRLGHRGHHVPDQITRSAVRQLVWDLARYNQAWRAIWVGLLVATFVAMEGVAYLLHRHVMHGPLWVLHESHHRPRSGRFERNDLFGVFFALPSIALIYAGTHGHPLALAVGIGMTAYGMAYFGFHDVVVHRRVQKQLRSEERIPQAHRARAPDPPPHAHEAGRELLRLPVRPHAALTR